MLLYARYHQSKLHKKYIMRGPLLSPDNVENCMIFARARIEYARMGSKRTRSHHATDVLGLRRLTRDHFQAAQLFLRTTMSVNKSVNSY